MYDSSPFVIREPSGPLMLSCLLPCAVFATLMKLLAMPGDQLALTSLLPPVETRAIEGLIAALNLSFAVSSAGHLSQL